MGINSDDGFGLAFTVFPLIFVGMLVLVVGGWITTAVVIARNRRVLRQAGIDPTTAGAQLAVRMIRGQPGAAPPSAAPPSAAARLAELTDLRNRGLITPDEYEARRAQIIAAI
jgi:hypothetical protein